MTLDETIKEYMGMSEAAERFVDKYSNRDAFVGSVIKDMQQRISKYRQLAEWLTELKEAKKLLKLAVEDIYNARRGFSCAICDMPKNDTERCDGDYLMPDCQYRWRYEAEALKLLGENTNETNT